MEKTKERYYVSVTVTSYCKRYLLNNFGVKDKRLKNLINLREDKELHGHIRRSLMKPVHRDDKKLSNLVGAKRNCTVLIEISEDEFNRYGYSISHTDECQFAGMIERRCKAQLLAFMSFQVMIHETISYGIRSFYKTYHYDELSWPELSIRKILQRNKNFAICELKSLIPEQCNKIFMAQMSQH